MVLERSRRVWGARRRKKKGKNWRPRWRDTGVSILKKVLYLPFFPHTNTNHSFRLWACHCYNSQNETYRGAFSLALFALAQLAASALQTFVSVN